MNRIGYFPVVFSKMSGMLMLGVYDLDFEYIEINF